MCVHIWMYSNRVWCMNAFFTYAGRQQRHWDWEHLRRCKQSILVGLSTFSIFVGWVQYRLLRYDFLPNPFRIFTSSFRIQRLQTVVKNLNFDL